MPINVNFFNYCQNQSSSTGVEPSKGEVLAPMFVQNYYMSSSESGLIRGTFRQCRIMGIPILTAFVPVAEEEYEQMVWWYNNSVNDYLGVKKSAGYKKVNNAQKEGLKLYKELNK
ncbi:hypothetical protein [Streptococcus uberis]|uniref:hypothetical protein n=1 Tax=Streptococcus uberis TaxID=1349 RepID=UPI001FF58015|nr:hypothetical protein [Streptococcus uberis]MCK1226930.1 hypothetical protein [Streptococcus uberis]